MTKLLLGNCLDKLKELPENSIDSIVVDPPYGLSFMGKKWDHDVPSVEIWKECLRVLKHGGHLLSFGGTRTYHRMAVNIEDAGFEIRDCIQWLYGSGFPKSTDVSKRIDKESGAEPTIIGENLNNRPSKRHGAAGFDSENEIGSKRKAELKITKPTTDSAKQWEGWGTALKPANEPIVVARKPLEKGLTVAENVLKYGTGAINIDGCRIELNGDYKCKANGRPSQTGLGDNYNPELANQPDTQGRWPANIILDEVAASAIDTQQPDVSRFFYVAKASKSERNKGLEGMPLVESDIKNDSGRGFSESDPYKKTYNQNHHPTVKPVKLMQYLIKLVTPPNGTVLDPFMGSGSTGVAAKEIGFKFVGCEMNEDYFKIASKRIDGN